METFENDEPTMPPILSSDFPSTVIYAVFSHPMIDESLVNSPDIPPAEQVPFTSAYILPDVEQLEKFENFELPEIMPTA